MTMRAKKSDWRTIALPSSRTTIRVRRTFTPHEIRQIQAGFVPRQMEDKWFVYWQDDTLYFHRSWTGYCIFAVRFAKEKNSYRITQADLNRDPEQYEETSDKQDAELISRLIDMLLLQKQTTFSRKAPDSKNETRVKQTSTRGSRPTIQLRANSDAAANNGCDDKNILLDFLQEFRKSFRPRVPYRGIKGTNWFISKVWSDDLRRWLRKHYQVRFEYPLKKKRRLDAALSSKTGNSRRRHFDIALEWEWDNNKVAKDFIEGDFRKLLEFDAKCGLAIVQTRVHGKQGSIQAENTLSGLKLAFRKYRQDSRPVAVIEIRRLVHEKSKVAFVCYFHDLNHRKQEELARWRFS